MADVVDVAIVALSELGSSSTMKLQKIVYYSQAYHLVTRGEALFENRIEAWRNGPVAYDLYKKHEHEFVISNGYFGESIGVLSLDEIDSIRHVVQKLKDKTGQELSEMTHSEKPWQDARVGLRSVDPGNREITQEAIRDYYFLRINDHVVFSN